MWRYPFLNLGFVILVITIVTLQHSVIVFGPTAHSRAVTSSDQSQIRFYVGRRIVEKFTSSSRLQPNGRVPQ